MGLGVYLQAALADLPLGIPGLCIVFSSRCPPLPRADRAPPFSDRALGQPTEKDTLLPRWPSGHNPSAAAVFLNVAQSSRTQAEGTAVP